MSAITIHQCPSVATDPNNKLTVARTGEGVYKVAHADGPGHEELVFQTLQRAGLTNEALLAIVYDRLGEFQQGVCKCDENENAMGHISAALHHLKNRTIRRNHAGLEGKMAEEKKHRVRLEDDVLHVGDETFTLADLQAWKAWGRVEAAAKKLDPQISALEIDVFDRAAAHLGGGARNGLSELKSALASCRKAG